MKRIVLLLLTLVVLSLSAAALASEGSVFLTTDQLPFDSTPPSVPKYTLQKSGDTLTLKGGKVTDQEYTEVYASYQVNGKNSGAAFSYDSSKKAWVSKTGEDLSKLNLKNVTLYLVDDDTSSELTIKDHKFVDSYDGENDMFTTHNKRQYWGGGDAYVAKYGRDGTLERYTVIVDSTDKAGNTTTTAAFSAGGTLRSAEVQGADGKTYYYNNGVWKTPKLDKDGNEVVDKDGNTVLVSASAPKGYNKKDLNKFRLTLKQPKRQWYENNTVGVRGISLREQYPDLTSKWYNVVPVDLTKNGSQTFELVASNRFIVGQAVLTVQDGTVTVDYQYYQSDLATPLGETIALFTSLDQLTTEFLENPVGNISAGQAVSIEDDLGGADTALLFMCNRLTYTQPYTTKGAMLSRFWPNHPRYKQEKAEMKALLEKLK